MIVNQGSGMNRILLLGGTTEASRLARDIARARIDAIFSYAGRTNSPMMQPLPMRIGGFGGIEGLAGYLRAERITHVVDATHPFAARMSANAVAACAREGVSLCALERAPWVAQEGDDWSQVANIDAAVAALPNHPTRVFLAIGKQNLAAFATQPQHQYLLRLVDPPDAPIPLPHQDIVIARGPFDVKGDTALMRSHRITHVIAKNAGGAGAAAKLTAARKTGAQVIMIDRPQIPARPILHDVDAVMRWLDHT
jgi:precorrin-6A/cobalt-precorrin-6A reductase